MAEEIINKVAESGLINLDLEEWYPQGERVLFDIAPLLWEGMALKEKDFRAFVKENDWSEYAGKYVAVQCSVDAIIPTWAYMLLASELQPHAKLVVFGTFEDVERTLFTQLLQKMDLEPYRDQRVIVKGCSRLPVPLDAYVQLVTKIRPVVKSLMFGEACSTVPLYKAPR